MGLGIGPVMINPNWYLSESEKIRRWTFIELAVVQARDPGMGNLVSRTALLQPTLEEVAQREKVTDHDVAAFVDCLQERCHKAGWDGLANQIHFGLTSSDVVDTALCWSLRDALEAIAKEALERRVDTRHIIRLMSAQTGIAVGKLSGAVGRHAHVSPETEEKALRLMGLRPVHATQVISRDRHAEVIFALAMLAPSARRWMGVALENVALWHERDISHSSTERIMFESAISLAWEALESWAS